MTGGRGTLSRRVVLLAVGIAVLTALLAGLLAVSLTRTSADDSARGTLAAIADAAAVQADSGAAARVSQNRAVRTLGTLGHRVRERRPRRRRRVDEPPRP